MTAWLAALGSLVWLAGPEPVRVAAASDLAPVCAELGPAFERETGLSVTFSFGSSGQLARQIHAGAPFDVFASASGDEVEPLLAQGDCQAGTRVVFALGRLVLWARAGAAPPPASLAELASPKLRRVAIANPEHAPYGRAARAVLARVGIWEALAPRLVYAENVRQALQLAQSGNADVALVARSLAGGAGQGQWVVVDPALHPPIEQTVVVCNHGAQPERAVRFSQLLTSPEGRAVLTRFGFVVPAGRAAP